MVVQCPVTGSDFIGYQESGTSAASRNSGEMHLRASTLYKGFTEWLYDSSVYHFVKPNDSNDCIINTSATQFLYVL